MIDVCYCFTDPKGTYSQIAGASMASLFMTTKHEVVVHLFHDNTLTQSNYKKFQMLAKKYDRKIIFYNIDILMSEQRKKLIEQLGSSINPRITIGTMYRLFISYILPKEMKKIIYLDCDTIVNTDIINLWNENLEGCVLAAVSDTDCCFNMPCSHHLIDMNFVSREQYFCAGVLVLDLDKIRTYNLLENGVSVLKRYPECDCMDQDILNYYFSKEYKQLNVRYNIFVQVLRSLANRDLIQNSVSYGILHYSGDELLIFPAYDVNHILWLSFFQKHHGSTIHTCQKYLC